ncbi:hypothetical protein F66182_18258 [Fusarium sp. NRRL 66182]|nr:hypothetical protein F66182_18258 [Fusarium sp. NRRL 66182]
MTDRFHIGEEAAESQGTWNRGFGKKQMREEEEQEAQDEAEGLVDQRTATSALPGIQGMLPGISSDAGSSLPGIGNYQPPVQANMPMQNMDANSLATMMGGALAQTAYGSYQNPGFAGLMMNPLSTATPPPSQPPKLDPNLNLAALQKQLMAQGIQLPANFANPSTWHKS